MKLLILNGPNLNMLGIREPDIYGKKTYKDLEEYCLSEGKKLGLDIIVRQSNHEGVLIDEIQNCYQNIDGLIINGGGYTHTSIAIMDAIKAVSIPTVEVHLSDLKEREDYRKVSYLSYVSIATVMGLGFEGYRKAMEILKEHLKEKQS